MNYGCNHKYPDNSESIKVVWCKSKDKYGKEVIVRDYAYCELCGKRFCIGD